MAKCEKCGEEYSDNTEHVCSLEKTEESQMGSEEKPAEKTGEDQMSSENETGGSSEWIFSLIYTKRLKIPNRILCLLYTRK